MTVRSVPGGREASFDFVLNVTGPSPTASPTVTPTSTPTSPPGTTTWVAYHAYALGERVTYAGLNYQCQIAHTSLPGWEPPNTPALWRRL